MSYTATFASSLFNGERDAETSAKAMSHFVELLFRLDIDQMRENRHPGRTPFPFLYATKVRYHSMAPPCPELQGDLWLDATMLLQTLKGDCKDLSAYHAAWMNVYRGVACRPVFRRKFLERGFSLYHFVVLWPDGRIEDPSVKLGMSPEKG